MSIFRENLDLFYDEGDDVTVYPVPAESIQPFIDGGGIGTTVRGLFHTRDVLVGDGDVELEDQVPIFETLKTRSEAAGIKPGTHSIEFDSARYNIIRCPFKDPGFVECWLEDLVT